MITLFKLQSRKHPTAVSTSRTRLLAGMVLALATASFVRAADFVMTGPMAATRHVHTLTPLPNGKVLVAGGSNSGGVLASAELYDPATGKWTTTGSMNVARYYHTATLLPNGKVLVTGGQNSGGILSSAELYDPATGAWMTTNAMSSARNSHTSTLLPNGRILVAGGNNGSSLAGAELYDPVSGTWSPTGSMNSARNSHAALLLSGGQVLVAGGSNGQSVHSSAELYDPATGSWLPTGTMKSPRRSSSAALLSDGKVLVAGGEWTLAGYLSSAELYDPATGLWSWTGTMQHSRRYHTVTLLPNGKVLVAGGQENNSTYSSSAELFNPATGTWAATGTINTARAWLTAALLASGKVLLAGGMNSDGHLASAELYDPYPGAWSATGLLNTARSDHTATLLPNGKVLAAGGNGSNPLAAAELYDPAVATWTTTGSMNTARNSHTATLLANGKVLVAGGMGSNNVLLAGAELYDPATEIWTASGALGTARCVHTSTLLPNGKILTAGGNGGNILSSAELYDIGLGFSAVWRPQIATITTPLPSGGSLSLSGSGFRGLSGASGGSFQDASSSFPMVQLRSLENAQTLFLSPANWSDSSYASSAVSGLPPGWAMATVIVNGIPSTSSMLKLGLGGIANLSNLVLSSGTLAPVFANGTTGYTASASHAPGSVTVTPTLADGSATARVRVNGGSYATVPSGTPSGALALNAGLNSIDIQVTAEDGTVMLYTVAVTRTYPSISVKDGQNPLADGGTSPVSFGCATREKPASATLTVTNDGTEDLILGTISKDGANAGYFTVGAPVSGTVSPGDNTALTILFTPAASGTATAVIHIASNVTGEINPFDITLSGTGLSDTNDTDGDDMNDAAEFNLAALGFDWQVSQPEAVATYYAGANSAGLYTTSQVHAVHLGTPLLARDPFTGRFRLIVGVSKSTDLSHFTAFPMSAPQTAINANGELEFSFDSPDHAAFFRVEAK